MRSLLPVSALALLSACGQQATETQSHVQTPTQSQESAQVNFDEARFREDIKTLSSDKFEGRAPTTHGEKLTLDYLTTAFKEMGLSLSLIHI